MELSSITKLIVHFLPSLKKILNKMDRAQCTEVTVQEQAQQKSEITLKGDLTMVSNDLEKRYGHINGIDG